MCQWEDPAEDILGQRKVGRRLAGFKKELAVVTAQRVAQA